MTAKDLGGPPAAERAPLPEWLSEALFPHSSNPRQWPKDTAIWVLRGLAGETEAKMTAMHEQEPPTDAVHASARFHSWTMLRREAERLRALADQLENHT